MSKFSLDNLPKAPGTENDPVPTFDFDDDDEIVTDEPVAKTQPSIPEAPTRATPKTAPVAKHPNTSDIPLELIDTEGFKTAIQSASKARTMAAIYTKYAENNEIPPVKLLSTDDVLAQAIQDALIQQARTFYDVSREILDTTAKEGDAHNIIDDERITNVGALFEIHQSSK